MAKKITKKLVKSTNAIKKQNLHIISVKNVTGTPDTDAEILIKNKIKYTPQISVIIPVYNAGDYLNECLDSVCNQTLKEIEIICIDDGSTDSSLDILKEYASKDNRITVITQKNSGAGIARNCGLCIATGQFVAFMDPDDFYPSENTLKRLYDTALKNNVKVCGGTINSLKDNEITVVKEYQFEKEGIINYSDYQFDYGYTRFIYDRKMLADNNIVFPDYLRQQDPVFFVHAMITAEKFYATNEPTYIYRVSHTQKQLNWNLRKATDVANSLRDLLVLSSNANLTKLHKYISDRVCQNYFINVFKLLIDETAKPNDALKNLIDSLNYKIIYSENPDFKLPYFYNSISGLSKVSVVIPVYNVADYLPQCMDSVINQTHKNLEIICVNDGSTDNSLEILEKYAARDNRIKVVSQKNAGLSAARNTGLRYVNSEYVLFVDSDDYLSSDAVEVLYHDLIESNADVSVAGIKLFGDEEPQKLASGQRWFDKFIANPGKHDMPLDVRANISTTAWNKLYKMSIIKKHNISFPDGLINEDEYWIWAYMIHCKNYVVSAASTYFYLQRKTSIMGQRFNSKKVLNLIDIHKKLVEMFQDQGLFDKYQTVITKWFQIHIETLLQKLPLQFYRDALDSINDYAANYNNHQIVQNFVASLQKKLSVDIVCNNQDTNKPNVSVIIPVYNAEKFLGECLDSILNQTLKNIEVICVDDGSTDNSLKMLKEYAKRDNRMNIIVQANQRQGAARNNGIKYASGEYIFFMDADDWLDKTCLKKLYDKATKEKSELCIYGATTYNNETKTCQLDNWRDTTMYSVRTKNPTNWRDIKSAVFSHFAPFYKLYKSDFVAENNIKFAENVIYEDVIFSIKSVMLAKNISVLDENLYFYRCNTNVSTMDKAKSDPHTEDILLFMKETYDFIAHNGWFEEIKDDYIDFILGQMQFYMSRISDTHKHALFNGFETFITQNNLRKDIVQNSKFKAQYYKLSRVKFTVIIPVYNTENYVRETLDSVLSQTLQDFEIICINDGSKDNSLKILKEYQQKDSRIQIINQNNSGLSIARNKAMKIAKGEYFDFLDSDDYLKPETLAELYDKCKSHDLDMLSFSGYNFQDGTNVMEDNAYWSFSYLPKDTYFKVFSFDDCLPYMDQMHVSSCLTVYKREFVQHHDIWFPDGLCFEDNVFFYKALTKANHIGLFNNKLYCRRLHNQSITHNRSEHVKDIIGITDILLDYLKSINLDKNMLNSLTKNYTWSVLNAYNNSKNQKKYYKDCYTLLKKHCPEKIKSLISPTNRATKKMKVYLLTPYYLSANAFMKHTQIPVLKFKKHTKHILYSHSHRGKMDTLNANVNKIIQSVQAIKNDTAKQIMELQNQQNNLIKQINNFATIQENETKQKYYDLSQQINNLLEKNQTDTKQKYYDLSQQINNLLEKNQTDTKQKYYDLSQQMDNLLETVQKKTEYLFNHVSEITNQTSEAHAKQLNTLNEQISKLIHNHNSQVSDLNKQINVVADNHNTQLTDLKNQVKTCADNYDNANKSLTNQIHEANSKIDSVSTNINNFVQNQKSQFAETNQKIQSLDDMMYDLVKYILVPDNKITESSEKLYSTNNNDSTLNKTLHELGKFYYLPNKGNMGDVLLAFSTYQYLDACKFDYEVFDMTKINEYTEPFNFVYGGGGIWYMSYKKDYQELLEVFKNPLLKKCVILPSSFTECPDVLELLDERFIVFCREENSYKYCKSLNSRATFIMADDMAINADMGAFESELYNADNLHKFLANKNNMANLKTVLFRRYEYAYNRLMSKVKTIGNKKIAYMLREDKESINTVIPSDIDLSAFGGGYCTDKSYDYVQSLMFVSVINMFDIIVTDRLHIGICAAKLGKKVVLLDNSYGKVSGVYNYSMKDFDNVQMVTSDKVESLVQKLSGSNQDAEQINKSCLLPVSFLNFVKLYGSIDNPYGIEKRFWN